MLRLFGDRTSLLAALTSHWADGQLQLPSGSAAQTPPLPGKMSPLQPDQYHPPGGLMEQSNASLQRDDQS